jgi:ADP-ribose pyrophosphatase
MGAAPRRSGDELRDLAVDAAIAGPEILARSYRTFERYRVTLADSAAGTQTRDLVRVGPVVAILAVDLARDELVLIRQFRLGAHIATGKGNLVEIAAGRVEPGETPIEAARRECLEELGVAPSRLVPLFTVLLTPAVSDEQMTVFLGIVDGSKVPARTGAADENEEIRPIRAGIDDVLAAFAEGAMQYGTLFMALQWLALNRDRLDALSRSVSAAR